MSDTDIPQAAYALGMRCATPTVPHAMPGPDIVRGGCSIPVIGTADNSYASVFPFLSLQRDVIELDVKAGKPISVHQVPTSVLTNPARHPTQSSVGTHVSLSACPHGPY